jgi:hypothetical protein
LEALDEEHEEHNVVDVNAAEQREQEDTFELMLRLLTSCFIELLFTEFKDLSPFVAILVSDRKELCLSFLFLSFFACQIQSMNY